ncbi:uncharacterized protein CLUP02_05688 [Colletotrichum lupini]|uniref:Uncharacterized protein n=1 Tax=Colletotrichum lupini TaxID=145971 RepID=A0A9Q8SMP0_9PEZI|nr:uncharacterized protein CLUP02_05688 [Colletotrichum lupini]UQC80206.1 hypothetical protein CLUP02_05688 [Colletotrichum lupini]
MREEDRIERGPVSCGKSPGNWAQRKERKESQVGSVPKAGTESLESPGGFMRTFGKTLGALPLWRGASLSRRAQPQYLTLPRDDSREPAIPGLARRRWGLVETPLDRDWPERGSPAQCVPAQCPWNLAGSQPLKSAPVQSSRPEPLPQFPSITFSSHPFLNFTKLSHYLCKTAHTRLYLPFVTLSSPAPIQLEFRHGNLPLTTYPSFHSNIPANLKTSHQGTWSPPPIPPCPLCRHRIPRRNLLPPIPNNRLSPICVDRFTKLPSGHLSASIESFTDTARPILIGQAQNPTRSGGPKPSHEVSEAHTLQLVLLSLNSPRRSCEFNLRFYLPTSPKFTFIIHLERNFGFIS